MSSTLQRLHELSPDQAVVLATAGLSLIFVELNRPGRILAGTLGLLLLLLAAADLAQMPLRAVALAAIILLVCFFLLNLYRALPGGLLGCMALGVIPALRYLVRPVGNTFVHTVPAILCGGGLGLASAVLTRIAFRARRAKALN